MAKKQCDALHPPVSTSKIWYYEKSPGCHMLASKGRGISIQQKRLIQLMVALFILFFLLHCAEDSTSNPSQSSASKLQFTTSPSTIAEDSCSSEFVVQRQTEEGEAYSSGNTEISLTDSSRSLSFFGDNNCSTSITTLTIEDSESQVSFYALHTEVTSFTVTTSAEGLSSASSSIDVLQSVDNFVAALTFPASGSNEFSEPSSENLTSFNSLVASLLAGNTSGHDSVLSTLGYSLTFLTDDTAGTKSVVALKETGTTGGGTYLIYLSPTGDFIIEAPHPVFDSNTLTQSSYLFQKLKARAFLIAGTHRCASTTASSCSGTTTVCTGSSAAYPISDVAHNTNTYFQEAHKAASDFNSTVVSFSVHGKSASTPTASISNGRTTDSAGAASNNFADALEPLVSGDIDSCNDAANGNILCGTTNVQGRYTNGSSSPCTSAASSANDRFIHIEQNSDLRTVQSNWDHIVTAIQSTFN